MAVVEKLKSAADEIRRVRVDMAAAYQLAAKLGMSEGIDNHFSARLPGTTDRFFMNPKGLHWSEVTASDVLILDQKGEVIEGEYPPPRSGVFIHIPMHQAHPRGEFVFHTHTPWATALCAVVGGWLEMVHQNSVRFFEDVAYDDNFNGVALEPQEGERMAQICGDKTILFLANHGVISIAETAAEAFDHLYFLERACQVQVLAMSTGRPLRLITEQVVRETRAQFSGLQLNAVRHFAALKRILDREGSNYAS